MNLLLTAINAKYIHSNLAVYSLKAYAKEFQENIAIAEYTINHQADDILQDIYKRKPDVIAFSCYIWNLEYIKIVSEDLSRLLPHTDIWVGGPEVSYDGADMLEKCPWLRGILCQEGEETFRQLAAHYVCGEKELKEIKGLVFRDSDGNIIENSPRETMPLQRLPFVYKDMREFENKIVYYESSRGCPFSCSYCLSSIDKRLRFRSLEQVKTELSFFLENKVLQVKFVDRTFNCNHNHALEIWKFLKEQDNGITNFHFEIAADLLREEELQILNSLRPGQVQLEIGVQSTNEKTLKEIDRIMDCGMVAKIVKRIQAGKNIHQHLDLIAGLPYEDYISFQNSFNEVYALKPDQLQLGFLKVLKGSKMYKKSEEYGNCYKNRPQYEILYTKWISYEEILKLKAVEEMVEVYYNSHQFANTIEQLEKMFNQPFELYEALAVFYEQNRFNQMKHTRAQRLDHLRQFSIEQLGKAQSREDVPNENREHLIQMYEELLTLDLYLRENSKSRPEWAKDLSVYKAKMYDIYKEEEQTPVYLKKYQGFTYKQISKMTHFEVFHYPVLPEMKKGSVYYGIFDYRMRSPLNQDAAVYLIEEKEHDKTNQGDS